MFREIQAFFLKINRKYYFDYFIVLLLALVLFSWLQSSPTLPEPDSFYHAKMAVLLSEGQILHQFPWLQETDLKDNFVDHHFLYHLLLVPFVKIFNPLIGVKAATVIFASLSALIFYWLLKKFVVKWPFLFIIALLSCQPWLFRASLVKAPAILLIFLLLTFYFVSHKKHKLLALLSFFGVWLYAGWPLIPIMVILYVTLVWLLEKIRVEESLWQKVKNFLHIRRQQIIPWPAINYCLGGVIAGLIINPYFPNNLKFYWQQIIQIAVINRQGIIGVGGEWYPYGFFSLISDAALVCALFVVGLFIFGLTYRKQSAYSWAWSIMAAVFLILTLKSRRNVEFFAPFAVIFSAFAFGDYFKKQAHLEIKRLIKSGWQTVLFVTFLVIGLSFVFHIPQDLFVVKRDIKNGWPITHYQEASQWLKNNTPARAIVFNADWDDFPFLFYNNSQNYFLTGLDPTFMYEKNKERYWQYVNITLGKESFDLKNKIKNNFQADYVFLDNEHRALENNLKFNPDFLKVYQDDEGQIYQVINH